LIIICRKEYTKIKQEKIMLVVRLLLWVLIIFIAVRLLKWALKTNEKEEIISEVKDSNEHKEIVIEASEEVDKKLNKAYEKAKNKLEENNE